MPKCQLCGQNKSNKKDLLEHVEDKHKDEIPQDMSTAQYVYSLNHDGRSYGICRICGDPTPWNEKTGKPKQICGSPQCKNKISQEFEANLKSKRNLTREEMMTNKEHLKKMLANRKISGIYTWSDGKSKFTYTGSYEKYALEWLDKIFEIDPSTVMMPGPVLEYPLNNKIHYWITDMYLSEYNLIIEIKDGMGTGNKNTHPGFAHNRELEAAKDEYMKTQTDYNYIKLTNKNMMQLIKILSEIRLQNIFNEEKGLKKNDPIININESVEEFDSLNETVSDKFFTDNTYFISDTHIYKHIPEIYADAIIDNINKNVSENDKLIFLGDIGYKDDPKLREHTIEFISKINTPNKYLVLGNHDILPIREYYKMGFKGVYKSIRSSKYILTHSPCKVSGNLINIHGHIHLQCEYWGLEPKNHINVYFKLNPGFVISLRDALDNLRKNKYDGIARYDKPYDWEANIPDGENFIINEGYILDNTDIYHNKDKFDSGETNLCFIVGNSGSGKSTMARDMSNNTIEHYELDDVIANWNFNDDNLNEYGDLISSFFKKYPQYRYYTHDDWKNDSTWDNKYYEDLLIKDFVSYSISYAKNHRFTKFILEGIWISLFIDPSKLEEYAVYINGTSAIKSAMRVNKRDSEDKGMNPLKYAMKNTNIFDRIKVEKSLKKFREYFNSDSINESTYASTLDPDFKAKGALPLSTFKKMSLDDPNLHKFILRNPRNEEDEDGRTIKKLKNSCEHYGNGYMWIDTDNQKIVAQVFVNQGKNKAADRGVLSDLEVCPEYRGYGLSRQIIEVCMNELGADSMWVYKDNEIPIKLYKSMGFNITYEDKERYFMEYKNSINETSLTSKIDVDYKERGKKSLSSYKRMDITESFINKYKNKAKLLIHINPHDGAKNKSIAWMDSDSIVAVASVKYNVEGKYNWITAIEVLDEYQGYGLGTQVLDYAVKNMNGNTLTVSVKNEVALRMYKKYGFKISKESEKDVQEHRKSVYFMYLPEVLDESYMNEGIESLFLGHGSSNRMTLYHGSPLLLDKISPLSANLGTRLSRPRYSSFWMDNEQDAKEFAIFTAIRHGNPKFKIFFDRYGDWLCKKNDYADIMRKLKNSKVYTYIKSVPKNMIGLGHTRPSEVFKEYTVDWEVVPDKIITYGYKDMIPVLAEKLKAILPDSDEECKVISDIEVRELSRLKSSLLNKMIFYSTDKGLDMRRELNRDLKTAHPEYMNEAYVGKDRTIPGLQSDYIERGDSYYNIDKLNPKNLNILFITGISGSGKTTLANDLQKNMKYNRVELDYISLYYMERTRDKGQAAYDKLYKTIYADCPITVEFLGKNPPAVYGYCKSWADSNVILKEFMDWFIPRVHGNGNIYIINGGGVTLLGPEYLADKPVILKDINYIKTVYRRVAREFDEDSKLSSKFYYAYKALKTGLSKSYRNANEYYKGFREYLDNAESGNESIEYINEIDYDKVLLNDSILNSELNEVIALEKLSAPPKELYLNISSYIKDIYRKWSGIQEVDVTPNEKECVQNIVKMSSSLTDSLERILVQNKNVSYETDYENFLEEIRKFRRARRDKDPKHKTGKLSITELQRYVKDIERKAKALIKTKSSDKFAKKYKNAMYVVQSRTLYVINSILYNASGKGSKEHIAEDKRVGIAQNRYGAIDVKFNIEKLEGNSTANILKKLREATNYKSYKKIFDDILAQYNRENVSALKILDLEKHDKLVFLTYGKLKPMILKKGTKLYHISKCKTIDALNPVYKCRDNITFFAKPRCYFIDKIQNPKRILPNMDECAIYEYECPKDTIAYRDNEYGSWFHHCLYVETETPMKVKNITNEVFDKIQGRNNPVKKIEDGTSSDSEAKNEWFEYSYDSDDDEPLLLNESISDNFSDISNNIVTSQTDITNLEKDMKKAFIEYKAMSNEYKRDNAEILMAICNKALKVLSCTTGLYYIKEGIDGYKNNIELLHDIKTEMPMNHDTYNRIKIKTCVVSILKIILGIVLLIANLMIAKVIISKRVSKFIPTMMHSLGKIAKNTNNKSIKSISNRISDTLIKIFNRIIIHENAGMYDVVDIDKDDYYIDQYEDDVINIEEESDDLSENGWFDLVSGDGSILTEAFSTYDNKETWFSKLFGKNNLIKKIGSVFHNIEVNPINHTIEIRGINYKSLMTHIKYLYPEQKVYKIFETIYNPRDYKKYENKVIKTKDGIRIEYVQTYEFFALELSVLFKELHNKFGLKYYKNIAEELYEKTWLSKSDVITPDSIDMNRLRTIKYELKPYQKEFVQIYPKLKAMLNLNGYILSFDQGLGKTLTSIALATCLNKDKIYIVCPNALKENWALEIKSYFPQYDNLTLWEEEVYIYGVSKTFNAMRVKYIIVNQEAISKIFNIVSDKNNSMLIIDESHNFRNLNSARSQQLLELKEKIGTKDVLVMSGTPIKASPNEICPAMRLIDPLFTPEVADIYNRCFNMNSIVASNLIQVRFGKVMYRRTKDEVLKLPNKTIDHLALNVSNPERYYVNTIRELVKIRANEIHKIEFKDSYYPMKEEFRRIIMRYTTAKKSDTDSYLNMIYTNTPNFALHDMDIELKKNYLNNYVYPNIINEADRERLDFLVKRFVNMWQHCIGVALGEIMHPRRKELFIRLYEENKTVLLNMIRGNLKKVVIFTSMVEIANHIYKDLLANDLGAVLVTGNVKDKLTPIMRFKEDSKIDVLVATSQTLGTGVTLTEANLMLFFGTPWRSTDFNQCCDRIYRIGQTNDVYIYRVLLNSKELNLSTRMEDILKWSNSMFDAMVTSTDDKDLESRMKIFGESSASLHIPLISNDKMDLLCESISNAYNESLNENAMNEFDSDAYHMKLDTIREYALQESFTSRLREQGRDISKLSDNELNNIRRSTENQAVIDSMNNRRKRSY